MKCLIVVLFEEPHYYFLYLLLFFDCLSKTLICIGELTSFTSGDTDRDIKAQKLVEEKDEIRWRIQNMYCFQG